MEERLKYKYLLHQRYVFHYDKGIRDDSQGLLWVFNPTLERVQTY